MVENASKSQNAFDGYKARLDEIVDEVADESLSLDDALSLYEEAVRIGLEACDASEIESGDDEGKDIISDDSDPQIATETPSEKEESSVSLTDY